MNRRFKFILYMILTGLLSLFFSIPSISAEAIKTDLIIQRDEIQSILSDTNPYMPNSIDAFNTDLSAIGGIAYIDSVIADSLVDQTIVDQLTEDLQTLQDHLVTKLVHAEINYIFQSADASNISAYTLRSRSDFHAELDRIELILNNPRSGDAVINSLKTEIELASNLLILLADKTALNSAMTQATMVATSDGTLYTPNSFGLYLNAFNAFDTDVLTGYSMNVNEIYEFTDASVEEAQAALNQINLSMDILVLRPDKTELTTAYNAASAFDLSAYTPNSIAAFEAGLDLIQAVIANPNALINDLNTALNDLEENYNVLIELADVSSLEALNTQALLAYYEERLLYTENSHNLFKTAVLEYGTYLFVNTVISNLNVTQTEVDELAIKIQSALNLLVERGNVSNLRSQFELLLLIDLTPYTPHSKSLFESELSRIELILNSSNTDQSLSNLTLQEAMIADTILMPIADKQALINLIDSTKSYKSSDYTTTSFGYLQTILDSIDNFLLDLNVTQNEVDQFYLRLNMAITSLRTKLSPLIIQAQRGTLDINQYVVIGESWVTGYYSSDQSIVRVSPEGIASGIDYGETTIRVVLANGLYEDIPIIVKAKISTTTFILVLSLPVISVGIAFTLLFTNVEPAKVINKLRKTKQL